MAITMKLYMFQVAPNPTKVRLYIAEKAEGGAKIELEQVSLNLPKGEQRSPEQLARNPFGKLPVLELDDGTCLIESLTIIEYLEELHPDPPMVGADPRERARVRELERIAELGVLWPVGRIVHATNSPLGLPPVPEVAALFRDLLPDALRYLNERLADGRPFVAGEHPTIADCTLAASLQFARFGNVEIDPAFANLARWDQAYRERPAARSVLVL
ncbi:MAG: glutathione S-transferase family protein [Myxococcota bacterium]